MYSTFIITCTVRKISEIFKIAEKTLFNNTQTRLNYHKTFIYGINNAFFSLERAFPVLELRNFGNFINCSKCIKNCQYHIAMI